MIHGAQKGLPKPTCPANEAMRIAAFVKYLRARGLAEVHEPARPKKNRSSYVPHAFTHEELKNFFNACDSISPGPGHKRKCDKLKKLTAPATFRALYSTGIRTNEARLLAGRRRSG